MIFLAYADVATDRVLADGLADDAIALAPGLLAVDTELSRSKLYHGLKHLRAKGTPLLVTSLTEVPKLTGMEPGSLAWFRQHQR